MKPNLQKTHRTRRAIVDAFWALCADMPMQKVTVSALVKRASLNRSTFYEYYEDMPSFIQSVEDEVLDDLTTFMPDVFRTKCVDALVAHAMQVYQTKYDQLHVLMGTHGDYRFVLEWERRVVEALKKSYGLRDGCLETDVALLFAVSGITAINQKTYGEGVAQDVYQTIVRYYYQSLYPVIEEMIQDSQKNDAQKSDTLPESDG